NGNSMSAKMIMINPATMVANKGLASSTEAGVLKTIQNWRINTFLNVLANTLNGGIAQCTFTGTNPKSELVVESGALCCRSSSGCVQMSNKLTGKATWSNGISCNY